jgi:hypothetical protein
VTSDPARLERQANLLRQTTLPIPEDARQELADALRDFAQVMRVLALVGTVSVHLQLFVPWGDIENGVQASVGDVYAHGATPLVAILALASELPKEGE